MVRLLRNRYDLLIGSLKIRHVVKTKLLENLKYYVTISLAQWRAVNPKIGLEVAGSIPASANFCLVWSLVVAS